jgi:hypothetical protein
MSSEAGWVWEYTYEGRFGSPHGTRDLIHAVEETLDLSYGSPETVVEDVSRLWSRLLATGPRP